MTAISEPIMILAREAKKAARTLSSLSSEIKNRALLRMADRLVEETARLVAENRKDLDGAEAKGLSGAMVDRLRLTEGSIADMARGLREVAALPDPVGLVTSMWKRPNGLQVGRMRIPLGVIGIIYESRPNVTADAAGLCLKSGNGAILRGGSEAIHSNLAITAILKESLRLEGIPEEAIQIVATTDRTAVEELLTLEDYIDVIIPRGGEDLIRTVVRLSRIPVIKHYKGVCHIFVDADAEPDRAADICVNAKAQRPGVCNAMETMLVHRDIAPVFLPLAAKKLAEAGVTLRGCKRTQSILPGIEGATEDDWYEEYLDLILAVRIVDDMDQAMDHIATYGSLHTEAILTRDYHNAQRFINEVNSSTVLANASTRFSDGFQLGLGAEIGISTTKLHAFGPMGLEELTTTKFIIYGDGQLRS